MSRRSTPTAPPPSWADAVATVLANRAADSEQRFDRDAPSVQAALEALIATGRAVLTDPVRAGLGMPVTDLRTAGMSEPGISSRYRREPDPQALADIAFAFLGHDRAIVANIKAVTYVPPRRGAPAARAVFQVRLGDTKGSPFIHDHLPPTTMHYSSGGVLLLADADLDIPWLLGGAVDARDLDALGEAVRGTRRTSEVSPDEQARKTAALAAVREAYLAHRGPTPRTLSQDDIDVIVRTGLQQGLLINLDLVHAATDGRGSPNSTYPKLANAMARLAPRRPAADDDVDPALRDLWTRLREAATAAAATALAPEREALTADRAALAEAEAALTAERDQEMRAAAERETLRQRLEAELASAEARVDSLLNIERRNAQEIASLTAERKALQLQLNDATAALKDLQADHAAQREAHARALAAERELATAERNTAASARELAAAQVNEANERLAASRRDAEAKLEAMQRGAAEQLTQLRDALAQAQSEMAALDARRAAAEEALAEARSIATAETAKHASTRATLQQRVDALLAEVTAAQRALANLEGEHRAVVRERDRLDRLLNKLRPALAHGAGSSE